MRLKLKKRALKFSFFILCFFKMFVPFLYRYLAFDKYLSSDNFSWSVLKNHSRFISKTGDHQLYNEALKKLIGGARFPEIKSAEFVGGGGGADTLSSSYRKVYLRGFDKPLFEKVYKSDSDGFLKARFFDFHIYSLLQDRLSIPKLVDVFCGEQVSIFYYEWFDCLEELDSDELVESYKIFRSLASEAKFSYGAIPDAVFDFSRDPFYKDSIGSAHKFLLSQNKKNELVVLNKLSDYVNSFPFEFRVFSHGDLNPGNVFKDLVYIDFDRCGFYPLSYDLAYVFTRWFCYDSASGFSDFFNLELEKLDYRNRVAFYFFSFLFLARQADRSVPDEFLIELWGESVSLFNNL